MLQGYSSGAAASSSERWGFLRRRFGGSSASPAALSYSSNNMQASHQVRRAMVLFTAGCWGIWQLLLWLGRPPWWCSSNLTRQGNCCMNPTVHAMLCAGQQQVPATAPKTAAQAH